MKATVISDKEHNTELYQKLSELTAAFLNGKGLDANMIDIGSDDLEYCSGCFDCWTKSPGDCVKSDSMRKISQSFMDSDVVVYMSPVIFGHYSSNIKNILDRLLQNELPFMITRSDGSTGNALRYDEHPKQIILGYGNQISEEDVQLFKDVTMKHRKSFDVMVYQGTDGDITEALGRIKLGKAGGEL
jgi:multimeric flavodoxin WrbA